MNGFPGLEHAIVGTLGPTGFAALSWGAIALVLVVFAYVAWALVVDRTTEGR